MKPRLTELFTKFMKRSDHGRELSERVRQEAGRAPASSSNFGVSISPGNTALVLVNYQTGLMPRIPAAERVLELSQSLANAARTMGVHAIGTEHAPAVWGPMVAGVRLRCTAVIETSHVDACERLLEVHRARVALPARVIMAGCEPHVALLQVAVSLLRAGVEVWVAENACASQEAEDLELAMHYLRDAGARIASVERVIEAWAADGPELRLDRFPAQSA
jgi:hypothetical protein